MDYQFGLTIGVLVYMAFVFDLFGFLARDELWLRLLMLAASVLYLFYYYHVADAPLWDALITNATLAAANVAMIIVVILERTTFSMSRETAELFRQFPMLSPGQFRRLMKMAVHHAPDAPVALTAAGEDVVRLCYVLSGPVTIRKGAVEASVGAGMFVGELAFLTGKPATATVTAEPGARYLEWDAAALRRVVGKSPKLQVALQAQFNEDLVRKVSLSMPGLGG